METSFHLRKNIPLVLAEKAGPVCENWALTFGFKGTIDSDSGMILNLVHADKYLDETISENKMLSLSDLTFSFSKVAEKLQAKLAKHKAVSVKNISLEAPEGKIKITYQNAEYFCSFSANVLWRTDNSLERRKLQWHWKSKTLEGFLNQELFANRFTGKYKCDEWNLAQVEKFLAEPNVVAVTVESEPGKTKQIFKN